ncbi:reverse transcriptase/maturase family protein [Rouxiella chamberiensis]|uniref:reverse transcriptase/maturase family protein n=1 Tax=Rouxiella chamberiensis TaxID=1513468 RepID=UPI0005D4407C|nr:reverse transcriptase/maturase family protein [Rouxiella chamberiensis]
MKIWDEYDRIFKEDNLIRIYKEFVILSAATGIDNMTHKKLWEIFDSQISIIRRKVLLGEYRFTKYKLKLISKGRGKPPREISIPTIRDKIALRALCDFLQNRFSASLKFSIPQLVVKDIKEVLLSAEYDAFIKLDVSNFYPKINHKKLLTTLRKRIRDERILALILSAITAPTVSKSSSSDKLATVGVPQGLSISNVLAAIYLSNIDKYYSQMEGIKYFRYVDDILILCRKEECIQLSKDVIKRFKNIRLEIHDPIKSPDKSSVGVLGVSDFSYLGYQFSSTQVSAKQASKDRLRESIMSIFTGYKYSKIKSKEFLEWRVNLRITGCVFQAKSKGWLFFFSEINDEVFLHAMDAFINRLCIRYNVKINVKSFVRAFYQVKHNRSKTSYIPNFDNYTEEQMCDVLNKYFKKSTENMRLEEISYNFRKRISKQVKELETDITDAGY